MEVPNEKYYNSTENEITEKNHQKIDSYTHFRLKENNDGGSETVTLYMKNNDKTHYQISTRYAIPENPENQYQSIESTKVLSRLNSWFHKDNIVKISYPSSDKATIIGTLQSFLLAGNPPHIVCHLKQIIFAENPKESEISQDKQRMRSEKNSSHNNLFIDCPEGTRIDRLEEIGPSSYYNYQ